MNKLSFISFCVEYYAEHISKTGAEGYDIFKREKLLDLLESDYGDLHGMSMEYLMNFFDEYIGNSCQAAKRESHSAVRYLLLPGIVKMISEKYGMTEKDALDKFYTSATGASFGDDETGLYGQSALYIFGLFCEEWEDREKSQE